MSHMELQNNSYLTIAVVYSLARNASFTRLWHWYIVADFVWFEICCAMQHLQTIKHFNINNITLSHSFRCLDIYSLFYKICLHSFFFMGTYSIAFQSIIVWSYLSKYMYIALWSLLTVSGKSHRCVFHVHFHKKSFKRLPFL